MITTSSTPASTRLPVALSAAEIRIRTDWPANAEMSTDRVTQAASSSAAVPSSSITVWVVAPTIWTRKKSALDELLACAK